MRPKHVDAEPGSAAVAVATAWAKAFASKWRRLYPAAVDCLEADFEHFVTHPPAGPAAHHRRPGHRRGRTGRPDRLDAQRSYQRRAPPTSPHPTQPPARPAQPGRDVFHGRRGSLYQAYRTGQEQQLEALGLVVNAITLWNSRYTDRAVTVLTDRGRIVDPADIGRISPLHHETISLYLDTSGRVAAVCAEAQALGSPELLGPACTERDLAVELIVARVCEPASKLAATRWWADTTLAADLGVSEASTDEVYAAMDWLFGRQGGNRVSAGQRHLNDGALVYDDLSSSWVEGRCCPLAARATPGTASRAKPRSSTGLTNEGGCPISVQAFASNTADPTAFVSVVDNVRGVFNLGEVVMVGDRGHIGLGAYRCRRRPRRHPMGHFAAGPGDQSPGRSRTLQLSLFDQANVARGLPSRLPR